MQTYRCTCGNRLFFENTQCVACHAEVGWCEGCHRITTLEPEGDSQYRCSYPDCGQLLQKCHNYVIENICNRCFVASRESAENGISPIASTAASANASPPVDGEGTGTVVSADVLCNSCQLTDTIPDLNVPGHRERWARLEAAKRRLLYTLDRLALPYAAADLKLSFDFKANVDPPAGDWEDAGAGEVVYTGHADGKITINLREADDAEREKLRVEFHEAHRTLIGHFHHEVGHYYWQLLVQGRCEKEFKKLFGDHNAPPYAAALASYYQNGPREGWPGSFISAYASSHPWEDFAETFALYLDMVAVLDTANHLFRSIRVNFRSRSVKSLVERYQEIGILENEFNRTMGLIDLVPEVIVLPVVAKLEFIHKIVKRAGENRQQKSTAATNEVAAPVPALMQQGSMGFEPAIVVGGRG